MLGDADGVTRMELTFTPSLDLIVQRLPVPTEAEPPAAPDEAFLIGRMRQERHEEQLDAGLVRVWTETRMDPAFVSVAGPAAAAFRAQLLAFDRWEREENQRDLG